MLNKWAFHGANINNYNYCSKPSDSKCNFQKHYSIMLCYLLKNKFLPHLFMNKLIEACDGEWYFLASKASVMLICVAYVATNVRFRDRVPFQVQFSLSFAFNLSSWGIQFSHCFMDSLYLVYVGRNENNNFYLWWHIIKYCVINIYFQFNFILNLAMHCWTKWE